MNKLFMVGYQAVFYFRFIFRINIFYDIEKHHLTTKMIPNLDALISIPNQFILLICFASLKQFKTHGSKYTDPTRKEQHFETPGYFKRRITAYSSKLKAGFPPRDTHRSGRPRKVKNEVKG